MDTGFVVDNSIVMSWCFEDETNDYANSVLESLDKEKAFVPAIWPLEVGNVLLVAERKKRMSQANSTRFIALLDGLPIIVEQETPDRMMKEIVWLARKYDLSAYDASYLDLAMRLDIPISSLDTSLLKAAKKCKVPVYKPFGAGPD